MILILFFSVQTSPPQPATIDEYKQRCSNLKQLTNYVEPVNVSSKLKWKSSNIVNTTDHLTKEINQLQDSKYTASLRKELLGDDSAGNTLRKRIGTGSGSDDMNSAIKYHEDLQEKIAQDILLLTRNLKEQTITANQIIKKDTEVILGLQICSCQLTTKLIDFNILVFRL